MKLISLLPLNIREAEKEEKPADDAESGGENPFAAADDSGENSGEEADAEAPEGGEEEESGEEGGESGKESSMDIVFDPNKVRKYNTQTFTGNRGTVVNVSRFGVTVKLPDEKTLFVNFDAIL